MNWCKECKYGTSDKGPVECEYIERCTLTTSEKTTPEYFKRRSDTWLINGERKSINQDKDMVNHPPHYERDGAMECIEEMILIFGIEKVMGFCLCNAWKYRYRAADKNGIEDIKKSDYYMAKYKELKEELDKKNKTTWITTTPDNGNIRLC